MPTRVARLLASRLVERDSELGAIDRALAGARAGEGWLVLLEGPAGIGKTVLLDAARERAGRAGVNVLRARGGELERGFPYGVVRQLLEPSLQAAPPDRTEKLLAGAAAHAAPAVLGPGTALGDPAERAFAIVHGLYWLVANLAAESPLALLIDDVHWSDAPSLRFIVYLARRLEGVPATLIVSVRTGEGGADQALIQQLEAGPRTSLISPAVLSDAGVTSVLATIFEREPDAMFARSCREVTGGNPFYVRELATALKADGIEPTAMAAARTSIAGPRTIARATLAQLGRLSPDAAELARAIAVLGGNARLPRAATLAHLDDSAALTALDALVGAEVVLPGSTLSFRHPIVRTAIYDELGLGARSAAHREAAAMLAAEGADLDASRGILC